MSQDENEPASPATESTPAEASKPDVKKTENIVPTQSIDPSKLGILNEVSIVLTIEVGRAQIKIRDLLNLSKDSIINLNKMAGEPVDIYANGKLISKGNIITANGQYCVRLTSVPDVK